jgi:hypothetical protein
MSDTPQVINTLRTKAGELEAHIAKLERALAQARADLAHINASIMLFEAPPAGTEFPLHFNLGRLFKGRELGQICREALAQGPPSTGELAEYVIRAKGLDEGDKHLRTSIALRIVNAMRMAEKRGKAGRVGKRGSAIVWCGEGASNANGP